MVPEHARDKPIELWAQDEARVGQQGSLTYLWADKGSRPAAPHDQRYEWAYMFGAVCPARGVGAALMLPYANTEAMNLHLAEISACVAPGAHAVVQLDGAGWHRPGERLRLPDNISLLPQPPYAPELNPAEKHLAIPAPELSRQPRFRDLRGYHRRLLPSLERAHGAPKSHHLNRHTRVGKGQ